MVLSFSEIVEMQPHNRGFEAPPVFTEGEKVFAFHQNMLYEAKILKAEMRNKMNSTRLGEQELYYFIHYQGWKTKWDEWVNDSRILKYTEENREFQRRMREESDGSRKKKVPKRDFIPPPEPKKQRLHEPHSEDIIEVPDTLELPFILQKCLAEDYDMIKNQKMIVSMPVQYSVADILAGFTDEKIQNNETGFHSTIIADILSYFDEAIGTFLLYKFERPQYQQLLESTRAGRKGEFSQLYGAPHLLRLFYKLPDIVDETPLSEESKNLILFYVGEILDYMEKNSTELFTSKLYTNPTEGYNRTFS